MKLKEKTYKKFVEFFERMSNKHDETEFEIAYSEIQRETGVANITLKKGIQVLEADGVIHVSPGRNTRYGKFKYLFNNKSDKAKEPNSSGHYRDISYFDEENISSLINQQKNMHILIEQLRLRIRTQEMTISVILDRLAELEDRVRR